MIKESYKHYNITKVYGDKTYDIITDLNLLDKFLVCTLINNQKKKIFSYPGISNQNIIIYLHITGN
jgi:hypothetical protein